jgi:hypothetical protein
MHHEVAGRGADRRAQQLVVHDHRKAPRPVSQHRHLALEREGAGKRQRVGRREADAQQHCLARRPAELSDDLEPRAVLAGRRVDQRIARLLGVCR